MTDNEDKSVEKGGNGGRQSPYENEKLPEDVRLRLETIDAQAELYKALLREQQFKDRTADIAAEIQDRTTRDERNYDMDTVRRSAEQITRDATRAVEQQNTRDLAKIDSVRDEAARIVVDQFGADLGKTAEPTSEQRPEKTYDTLGIKTDLNLGSNFSHAVQSDRDR